MGGVLFPNPVLELLRREDYTVSHVPPAARAVLARFDERLTHYEVLEDRPQPLFE